MTVLKISLAQTLPMNIAEMVAFVRNLIANQRTNELSVANFVLFPEHSLRSAVFRGPNHLAPFKELLDLSNEIGIIFTVEERDDSSNSFVTSVVFHQQQLLASYRKQRATITGAHSEGNSSVFFPLSQNNSTSASSTSTSTSTSIMASILICFDIENAVVRDAVLSHRPRVVFNPTLISPVASPAAWRTAIDTMNNKFQKICNEHQTYVLRCDIASPLGAGSSQSIGNGSSVTCSTQRPTVTNVFIDTDENCFERHAHAPKRPRTKLEDNTGAVCQTKLYTNSNNDIVESFAIVSSNPRVVFAVFGKKLLRLNARDGSDIIGNRNNDATLAIDVCALNAANRLAVLSSSARELQILDSETMAQSSALSVLDGEFRTLQRVDDDRILLRGESKLAIFDVRTGVNNCVNIESTSCRAAYCDSTTSELFVGQNDGLATFDLRNTSIQKSWIATNASVDCVFDNSFSVGNRLMMSHDGSVKRSFDSPIVSLCQQFVGLADGSVVPIVSKHRILIHSTAPTKLMVSNDKCQLWSMSRQLLALTSFEFNGERAWTVDEMFIQQQ